MSKIAKICSVCAWRETCQKKFSVSGRDVHCPDFVEDLSLKKESDEEEKTGKGD